MYSLGLGVPFFLTGISINTFLSIFKKIRKYYRAIEIAIGVSLIIMGILLITDYFTILTSYLTRWFPWLLRG
jgi:cytochrome c-type biogenesis protein